MRKKTKYSDERLEMGEVLKDFLPAPNRLVRREKTIKVTLELTEDSIAFFKAQAKQESVPYQRMIRGLIDAYAHHHQDHAKH